VKYLQINDRGIKMGEVKTLIEWKYDLKPVLRSKIEEFHLMGYESVTEEELWKFITVKLKKKQQEWMLHQIVQAIFKLKANDFMNWLTIEAFQSDGLFSNK
jgi:hypothetical protein